MIVTREFFVAKYVSHLFEGDAALFAGAGLSVGKGLVDWAGLLKEIAEELGLKIDKEPDLLSIAQFHSNKHGRNTINEKIINEFKQKAEKSINHDIIARLPVDTIWTTNYDTLIEDAYEEINKKPDVKINTVSLANNRRGRDVTIYKMHGDVSQPENAVLTKDDYQSYHLKRQEFTNTLVSNLITKTFLFVGFSFSDPNLDYILGRARLELDNNARKHYCIIRKVKKEGKFSKKADYDYAVRRQELMIEDLNRFNIHTVLVEEYSDVTFILQEIENKYKQKTIFISGSAEKFGPHTTDEGTNFILSLSNTIIKNEYNIVTGFGLGVGSPIINGALQAIYSQPKKLSDKQLIVRPFPQIETNLSKKEELWQEYRRRMISFAGIAIFLFGNKNENGSIENSDGVRKEFEIAKAQKLLLLPIGATGYMAEELWNEVSNDYQAYFPNSSKELKKLFDTLSNKSIPLMEQVKVVDNILNLITKK